MPDEQTARSVDRAPWSYPATHVELDDQRLRVVTSTKTPLARNQPLFALMHLFPIMATLPLMLLVVLCAASIRNLLRGGSAAEGALFLLVMSVIAAAAIGLFIVFMWGLVYRSYFEVRADAGGIEHSMRLGGWRLTRSVNAWNQVAGVNLQPASAVGRVSYVAAQGPAFVGIGVDDDTARDIYEAMSGWWQAAATHAPATTVHDPGVPSSHDSLIDRLVSKRHPDSDERVVRVAWRTVLFSYMSLQVVMLSIAVWLLPPADPTFWLVGIGSPALGAAYGYVSLRIMGAFGQPPKGIWAINARNAREASRTDGNPRP